MVAQYFAQIDENRIVVNVHVVSSEFIAENPERYPGVWVETFTDRPDKIYAGIGYLYSYETQDFTPTSTEPVEL